MPVFFQQHELAGNLHRDTIQPTSILAETFEIRRSGAPTTSAALTSGTEMLVKLFIPAGTVVSTFNWLSAAVALTRGSNLDSHLWMGLADVNRNILAVSTDDTTNAWGANKIKSNNVGNILGSTASSYTVPADGNYYAFLMVAQGTGGAPAVPTLGSINCGSSDVTGMTPIDAMFGDGSQTTAPTFPTTITAGAIKTTKPYVYLT